MSTKTKKSTGNTPTTKPKPKSNQMEVDADPDFDTNKNLIVNYLPPTLSQDDVREIFARIGPVENCKLIRNSLTGQSLGYAFVKYPDEDSASRAISQINGMQLQGKTIKVSYARQSTPEIKNANVYIAGLPDHVTEEKLLSLFSPFGSVLSHKVLTNPDGSTRGAGFVRYSLKEEASTAIEKMAGKTLPESSTPLTVKLAIPPASKKDSVEALGLLPHQTTSVRFNPMVVNKTRTPQTAVAAALAEHALTGGQTQKGSVYVFGLQDSASELTLFELFAPFGGIINVKLIRDLSKEDEPCKGYGFVNYIRYDDAIKAVTAMNGVNFEEKVLQVSIKQNKNAPTSNGYH